MFTFERTYAFAVTPERLWTALGDIEAYRHWWPWLRSIKGDGLVAGGVSEIAIWAPIPRILHLRLTVTQLVPQTSIAVDVDGDLVGPAALDIQPGSAPASVSTRLAWELVPGSRAFRAAARLARPVLQSGQDWVVSVGVGQFRRRGLRA